MDELKRHAEKMRAAEGDITARNERAVREQRELAESRVAGFIRLLDGNVPQVPLFTEHHSKRPLAAGDRRALHMPKERVERVGYVKLGEGWVVQDFVPHDGWEEKNGVFVLNNGLYTRHLKRVDTPPSDTPNAPRAPFYTAGMFIAPQDTPNLDANAILPPDHYFWANREGLDLIGRVINQHKLG